MARKEGIRILCQTSSVNDLVFGDRIDYAVLTLTPTIADSLLAKRDLIELCRQFGEFQDVRFSYSRGCRFGAFENYNRSPHDTIVGWGLVVRTLPTFKYESVDVCVVVVPGGVIWWGEDSYGNIAESECLSWTVIEAVSAGKNPFK